MRKSVGLVLVLLLAGALAAPAIAQDESPGPITWIGFSKLNPGKSAEDALKLFLEDQEFMDGLVSDGTILSYGAGTPINHLPDDDWNYVEWVTVENWAKVDQWIGAFLQYMGGIDEKEQKARQAMFKEIVAPGSHYDHVVRHVEFQPHSMKPRYFYFANFTVKDGAGENVGKIFDEFVGPAMAGLQESGDMGSVGVYVTELHADHGYTHVFWYALPGLASIDKMQEAFAASAGPAEAAWAQSTFDYGTHEDRVLLVLHFGGAGASDE